MYEGKVVTGRLEWNAPDLVCPANTMPDGTPIPDAARQVTWK